MIIQMLVGWHAHTYIQQQGQRRKGRGPAAAASPARNTLHCAARINHNNNIKRQERTTQLNDHNL
jgi:hypothetical protein